MNQIQENTPAFTEAKRAACKNPKVSVVLPIYNVEPYLDQALSSLVAQTLEEMEFICVNDGSTDGSLAIMEAYAKKDGRFRVLDGPNGGYGKAMNRGVAAATGEYIGILEPDDFVPPEMYNDLYQVAKKNRLEVVKSNSYRFYTGEDGRLRKELLPLSRTASDYNRVICPRKEQKYYSVPMYNWAGIYRRDFLKKNHITHQETPGASYQDTGFHFQVFTCAKRMMFVDQNYYMLRRDNPGSSVFKQEKLEAITAEYHFVRDWLKKEHRYTKDIRATYYKRFAGGLSFTYRRIRPDLRGIFAKHMLEELKEGFAQGFLTEASFTPWEWWLLQELEKAPDAFPQKIFISAILPVYNNEKDLRWCLNSILQFNAMGMELICIDDGSTDGSLAILEEYAANDARVRLIRQDHGGYCAAANVGLDEACGEYLLFLDAAEIYAQNFMQRSFYQAMQAEADVLVFKGDTYCKENDAYIPMPDILKQDLLPKGEPFAAVDVEQDFFGAIKPYLWNKLFRTSFLKDKGLRFPDLSLGGGVSNFVYGALLQASRISLLPIVQVHYQDGQGASFVRCQEAGENACAVLDSLRQQLQDLKIYPRFAQDYINYAQQLLLQSAKALKGPAYFAQFKTLQAYTQGLDLLSYDADFFYDAKAHTDMAAMLSHSAEEYLFICLENCEAECKAHREEVAQLSVQMRKLHGDIYLLKSKARYYDFLEKWGILRILRLPMGLLRKIRK